MPWKFADPDKKIATDGIKSIPLGQPTQDSRAMDVNIASGLVISDFLPSAQPKPGYTLEQLAQILIAKGIVPPL